MNKMKISSLYIYVFLINIYFSILYAENFKKDDFIGKWDWKNSSGGLTGSCVGSPYRGTTTSIILSNYENSLLEDTLYFHLIKNDTVVNTGSVKLIQNDSIWGIPGKVINFDSSYVMDGLGELSNYTSLNFTEGCFDCCIHHFTRDTNYVAYINKSHIQIISNLHSSG